METVMARRQMNIPGTERKSVPEVEKAAEAYREVRDERAELSKRERQKKLELLAVMRANKVTKYKYDDEHGEEILVSLDERDPEISVKKTGEAESDIGEGVSSPPDGPMNGLINQALASQNEQNVEETGDGDVAVPEKAAPKAKKGRKAK
jgi:hypothetical protein